MMHKLLKYTLLLLISFGANAATVNMFELPSGKSAVTHAIHYNNLPDGKSADAALAAAHANFKACYAEVSALAKAHSLEGVAGLRLLHQHFPLSAGQLMVEQNENIAGIPSLVTGPLSLDEAARLGAVPASWMATSNGTTAFEFSTDLAVQAGVAKLQASGGFLDAARTLILVHGLQDLLAIAVLSKSLTADDSQIYAETSNETGHSVVQLTGPSSLTDTLTTAWPLISGVNPDTLKKFCCD